MDGPRQRADSWSASRRTEWVNRGTPAAASGWLRHVRRQRFSPEVTVHWTTPGREREPLGTCLMWVQGSRHCR